MQTAELPIRQTKEQMAKELESARRAFRVESKRPTLEISSDDVSVTLHNVPFDKQSG